MSRKTALVLIVLIILVLLLVSCSTDGTLSQTYLDAPGAQATAVAAQQQADMIAQRAAEQQQAIERATAVAAEATRQAQQAVANELAAEATRQALEAEQQRLALEAEAARQALTAEATRQAIAAEAERLLVADEARRLAIAREADRQRVKYQIIMNTVKPIIWFVLALAVLAVGAGIAYRLYNLSRPVNIQVAGGEMVTALPSGAYQIYAPRRLELPPPAPETADGRPILLPRLTDGHIMIVGTTGEGKSVALRELVDQRNNVVVLDPHHSPGAWGAAEVIDDYDAIEGYMLWMLQELDRRIEQRRQGQRDFTPLTVATEEMPLLADRLGRACQVTWRRWMREARKFNLFMEVVTQSTRVKSLKIEGESDLLDNFKYVLQLGSSAVNDYPELVAGMERPAVLRSKTAVTPVVIPYDPHKDPESPDFVPFYLGDGRSAPANGTPLFTAPAPSGPRGMNTKWGYITPEQVEQIIDMYQAGESGRAIQQAVFGYPGGAAYHMVNHVLENSATATNGRFLGDT